MSRTPSGRSDDDAPSGRDTSEAVAPSPQALFAEKIRLSAQRETVEAFVVAFILALLFRGFVAEAFVIPTGSMAPTLMGAHKDLRCDRCGNPFRVGASSEQREPVTYDVVVGGICGNCRYVNPLDLRNDPDEVTFSGDRILVSKFAYTIADPKRWDVIVFKFPGNPKQNYIKRLVGLPEETITIRHGDVFARPVDAADDSSTIGRILRKPASTLMAMRHQVYDSAYQSAALIQAGYPAKLQPWQPGAQSPPTDSWKVQQSPDGLTATLAGDDASDQPKWLRYYHRHPTAAQWKMVDDGQSLADVDPYDSRGITDFYAYNSYITVRADALYSTPPSQFGGNFLQRLTGGGYNGGVLRPRYQSGESLDQFRNRSVGATNAANEGFHWVGDLIMQADVQTDPDAQQLTLELVEAGVKHRCVFDLADGTATLSIDRDGESIPFEGSGDSTEGSGDSAESSGRSAASGPRAITQVRGGTRHEIRLSNCDDQLLLWVDDDLVTFDSPTTFDGDLVRVPAQQFPRFRSVGDPLDASPAGLAITGGGGTVHHVTIDRDKYYVATKDCSNGVLDYDLSEVSRLARTMVRLGDLQDLIGSREEWSELPVWQTRRSVSFDLQADQFFPMGDNSPESLDARCWTAGNEFGRRTSVDPDAYLWSDANYVPRDLLVGKALMVFWPHPWNSPLPMTPNIKRMKLIR